VGSFDVSCGLSNLSIESGDRAGLLLLNDVRGEYEYNDKLIHGEATIVYHNAHYRPFFGAIYGKYDDYGSLEDIEENVTTKVLEGIFGIPILSIVNIVTAPHYGLYNDSSPLPEAFGLPERIFSYGKTDGQSLIELGFTEVVKDKEYEFEGHRLIGGDRKWKIVRADGAKKKLSVNYTHEAVELFGDFTGAYPGYDKSLYEKLRTIRKLNGMFFHPSVFEAVKAVPRGSFEQTFVDRFLEKWNEYMDTYRTPIADDDFVAMMKQNNEFVSRNMSVPPEFRSHFAAYIDSDEIIDLYYLDIAFSTTNRMYAPTLYAGQAVEDEGHRALIAASLALLDERKAKYDEWDIEEDDEDEEDGEEV